MANIPEDQPAILDNPHSPDVFADFVVGAVLQNECLRLTFASNRSDYTTNPPTVRSVVIGRLVIPIAGAQNMVDFVHGYLEQLKTTAGTPPPSVAPRTLN